MGEIFIIAVTHKGGNVYEAVIDNGTSIIAKDIGFEMIDCSWTWCIGIPKESLDKLEGEQPEEVREAVREYIKCNGKRAIC